jgi:hypothetical protein
MRYSPVEKRIRIDGMIISLALYKPKHREEKMNNNKINGMVQNPSPLTVQQVGICEITFF